MKNKYLKILLLIALAAIMAISLISCGSSVPAANDDDGLWGNASWEYKKDTRTLTITCAGDMPNAASSDKVDWAGVRESVQKIVFVEKDGHSISNIGDYAFYGMTNLTTVTLPDSVTSIGKCAFAFCSSLETLTVPSSTASIGESAFEACTALKSITLPGSVTKLGARAFAYCHSLTSATVAGKVESIPANIFTGCKKLTSLTVLKGIEGFKEEDFTKNGIAISYTEGLHDTTDITIRYKDTEGNELKDAKQETKKYGDSYSFVAPEISGYNVKGANNYTGKVSGEEKIEKTFVYEKIAETEAPPATDAPSDEIKPAEDEGFSAQDVIGIVVLAVVIVGIAVGAVLLVRSNKKQQKGSTVRKNQNKKK